jgi:hypothetical protein
MENFLYGRLTTLNYLKERRDDPSRLSFRRMQADRAIHKIVAQLRDRKLMKLRERLIRANKYGDTHAIFLIENQLRAYERDFEAIESAEYTQQDEDY